MNVVCTYCTTAAVNVAISTCVGIGIEFSSRTRFFAKTPGLQVCVLLKYREKIITDVTRVVFFLSWVSNGDSLGLGGFFFHIQNSFR